MRGVRACGRAESNSIHESVCCIFEHILGGREGRLAPGLPVGVCCIARHSDANVLSDTDCAERVLKLDTLAAPSSRN